VDGFWLGSSSWNITSEVREEEREKELHIKYGSRNQNASLKNPRWYDHMP
jgi:hypothetical protein